jgi:hypothetical protein
MKMIAGKDGLVTLVVAALLALTASSLLLLAAQTAVDVTPFPLGVISPTAGTPAVVTTNYSTLMAGQKVNALLFQALSTNVGLSYVGASWMSVPGMTGVMFTLTPGQTISFGDHAGGNRFPLAKYYVDVATTGDDVMATAFIK